MTSPKTTVQTIHSDRIGDSYYKIQHASGLTVFVYPKEENHSAFASFAANFGSINTAFQIEGEEGVSRVPDGIAHYLEHKLFESEEGDAFLKFSKTGASANAYTSFDSTCYIVSSSENLYESLKILLSFVQDPFFTKENVAKEQGIIGQEIQMYEDDPQWKVMFNLLRNMYHTHPVRNDIAGTLESIAEITPEDLYLCYNTFYTPSSMVLAIAGKIDVDTVIGLCDRLLKNRQEKHVRRIFENEPETVLSHRVEQKLPVAIPLFQFGFKRTPGEKPASVEKIAATEILLEIMAADSSPLFRRLLDAELINETSFDTEYFEGPGYDAVFFSGESRNPDAVAQEILKEAESLRKRGISEIDFLRAKKSVYGRNVSALNSTDSIANSLASMHFSGRELFSYLEALINIEPASVFAELSSISPANSVLSVILPED